MMRMKNNKNSLRTPAEVQWYLREKDTSQKQYGKTGKVKTYHMGQHQVWNHTPDKPNNRQTHFLLGFLQFQS